MLQEFLVKMILAAAPPMLTVLLMLPANGSGQTPPKASTFTIAGYAGNAPVLRVNGKSFIEVEALARMTQGTLSFKADQTTLTLPSSSPEGQSSAPRAKVGVGFSVAFNRAGIEEISVIREWRTAIVNAVQNNTPVAEDWVSAQQRLADKNLALASAAVFTDDDSSAYPLLSAEFNNMQKLSDLYLAIRQKNAFISPDTFHSGSLEKQILTCAQGFASMAENHAFQDQPACH